MADDLELSSGESLGVPPIASRTDATLWGLLREASRGHGGAGTGQPWIGDRWVARAMERFGADAGVIVWPQFPPGAVILEDIPRLLEGQRPGDNIMNFFSCHPRVRGAISQGGEGATAQPDFFVVDEADRPLVRCFGTDFFREVVGPGEEASGGRGRFAAKVAEARSAGRYLSFSILDTEHCVECLVDLWGKLVFVMDGLEAGAGGHAGMSSSTRANAEKVAAWANRVFAGYQRPSWAPDMAANPNPNHNGSKPFTVVEAGAPPQKRGSHDCLPLAILVKTCILLTLDAEAKQLRRELARQAVEGGGGGGVKGTCKYVVFDADGLEKMWSWADGKLYKDVAFLRRMIAQTLIACRSKPPRQLLVHAEEEVAATIVAVPREGRVEALSVHSLLGGDVLRAMPDAGLQEVIKCLGSDTPAAKARKGKIPDEAASRVLANFTLMADVINAGRKNMSGAGGAGNMVGVVCVGLQQGSGSAVVLHRGPLFEKADAVALASAYCIHLNQDPALAQSASEHPGAPPDPPSHMEPAHPGPPGPDLEALESRVLGTLRLLASPQCGAVWASPFTCNESASAKVSSMESKDALRLFTGVVCTAVLAALYDNLDSITDTENDVWDKFKRNIFCQDLATAGCSATCEKGLVPGLSYEKGERKQCCRKCFGPALAQAPKDGAGVVRVQTSGRMYAMLLAACRMIAGGTACLSPGDNMARFVIDHTVLLASLRDAAFGGLSEEAQTAFVEGLFPQSAIDVYRQGLVHAAHRRERDGVVREVINPADTSLASMLAKCWRYTTRRLDYNGRLIEEADEETMRACNVVYNPRKRAAPPPLHPPPKRVRQKKKEDGAGPGEGGVGGVGVVGEGGGNAAEAMAMACEAGGLQQQHDGLSYVQAMGQEVNMVAGIAVPEPPGPPGQPGALPPMAGAAAGKVRKKRAQAPGVKGRGGGKVGEGPEAREVDAGEASGAGERSEVPPSGEWPRVGSLAMGVGPLPAMGVGVGSLPMGVGSLALAAGVPSEAPPGEAGGVPRATGE